MKNKLLILFITLLMALTLTSCYKAPKHDITVYKTSAGTKYHTERCRYTKGKGIAVNLSRAIYDDLTPCKACKPQVQSDLETLNK